VLSLLQNTSEGRTLPFRHPDGLVICGMSRKFICALLITRSRAWSRRPLSWSIVRSINKALIAFMVGTVTVRLAAKPGQAVA
jgi:hypothetical protein